MMYQPIDVTSSWCILRTSGGKTLALAQSMNGAGIEAWTPKRTFKRPKPGRCNRVDGKRSTVEIDAPILPTFVFVRAPHSQTVAVIERDPASQHPPFSILRGARGIPFIADREVEGLRAEERSAADLLEKLREAESREERRRLRAAAARNERERRNALMSERRHFALGQAVTVDDSPAFGGMSGIVEFSDGRHAIVRFSPMLMVKIEAWQLTLDPVQAA